MDDGNMENKGNTMNEDQERSGNQADQKKPSQGSGQQGQQEQGEGEGQQGGQQDRERKQA